MNEEYIDIQVYDGDDETRYIKYEDMINLIERIKSKQEELQVNGLKQEILFKLEIERLNNIIKEAKEYIEERYNGEVLTHTFDKCNVGELLNILKGVDKE